MSRTRNIKSGGAGYQLTWKPEPELGPGLPNVGPINYRTPVVFDRFEVTDALSPYNTRGQSNSFEHYLFVNTWSTGATAQRIVTKSYVSFYLGGNGHYSNCGDITLPWLPASNEFGTVDKPVTGLPVLYEVHPDGTFIKVPSGIDSLILSSQKVMLPGIRPRLSLINSLIELKDFRSLPRTLRRVKETVRDILNGRLFGLRAIPSLFRDRKPLKRILGATADVYLQKEFNILPLLRDIAGLKTAISTVREEVNKLIHDEGRIRAKHYSKDLRGQFRESFETSGLFAWPVNPVNTYPNQLVGQTRVQRSCRYEEATFHASILYSYYYSDYQRRNAEMLALLDALGVNLNPAIIWNAIPWTFVVDWVVNISSWLDSFKVQNMKPVTLIHDWSWSVSIDRYVKTFGRLHEGTNDMTPYHQISLHHETAYKRSTRALDIVSALSTSGISPKEYLLASALTASRRR